MTRQEFKNLPATKKGLRLLENEFKKTNNVFFLEVSRELKDRLNYGLPRVNFFQHSLNKYDMIIEKGYRKELVMPF